MYAEKEYQKRYQKEQLKLYSFRLNMNNEKERELAEWLDQCDNKRRWLIKSLVKRMDIDKVVKLAKEDYERRKQANQVD